MKLETGVPEVLDSVVDIREVPDILTDSCNVELPGESIVLASWVVDDEGTTAIELVEN